MNLALQRRSKQRGILLTEALVYVALLGLVLALAFPMLHRAFQNSRDLDLAARDILQVMRAGEQWREDIRAAVGMPEVLEERGSKVFQIPHARGWLAYTQKDGCVWRQGPGDRQTVMVLSGVRSSAMLDDSRKEVYAYRWEIELEKRKQASRLRPLFTFVAAPIAQGQP